MKRLSWVVLLALTAACGGNKPAPASAPASNEAAKAESAPAKESSEPEAEDEPDELQTALPTKCAGKGKDICTPKGEFVNRLCQDTFPSVALALFKKGTPWTRGYLTRKTKAWNASGGASDAGMLEFDEEVLVLRRRGGEPGGMQVSGSGGYDALRWSGSCVTLASEELTLRPPPKAKNAHVEWRFLDDALQEKLRANEKVNTAYRTRRNECKGATMGAVSAKCEKADAKLSDVIVEFVREGGEVPTPAKLP